MKKTLEDKGLNSDDDVKTLIFRATEANITISRTSGKVISGYIGKPKGAAQITAEQGFNRLDGTLANVKSTP